jgi:hypothetical protein
MIAPPSGTSTSGSTAFTWKPGWRTRRNASWSSLARRRRARRSWSASPTAYARVRNRGASCCSISSAAVCQLPRSWPWPTVRSTSGRRSATNPIESTFATVRHRTIRSKGCLSNKTALAMVFKLVEAALKSWRRLRGYNQLPKVIQGVTFTDGIEVVRSQAQAAA